MCYFDEKTQTLQDPWHVDDVLNQRPDLTEDQAIEVLSRLAITSMPILVSIGRLSILVPSICFHRRKEHD
jgi:hypothetical protein